LSAMNRDAAARHSARRTNCSDSCSAATTTSLRPGGLRSDGRPLVRAGLLPQRPAKPTLKSRPPGAIGFARVRLDASAGPCHAPPPGSIQEASAGLRGGHGGGVLRRAGIGARERRREHALRRRPPT
jgi:hypothetical protein